MKYFLIFAVLLSRMLQANDFKESPQSKVNSETSFETQENHFVHSQKDLFSPKVDPWTGALSLQSLDFTVAGIQPLDVSRTYSQFSAEEIRSGNWHFFLQSFIGGNLEYEACEKFLSVGNQRGGVTPLFEISKGIWQGDSTRYDYYNPSQSGSSHPDNLKLNYQKIIDPKNAQRFQFKGSIVEGDGTERFFFSKMHAWNGPVDKIVRTGGYLWGTKTTFTFFPLNWTPYQIPVTEERLPNGNWIVYTYIDWRDNRLYPRPPLLKKIQAFDRDKKNELSSLTFEYDWIEEKNEDPRWNNSLRWIRSFSITGSDGRQAKYYCSGKEKPLLNKVVLPNQMELTYEHDDKGRITSCKCQGAVAFEVGYQEDGKVSSITERGIAQSIWSYKENITSLVDPEGKRIEYWADPKGRPWKTIWYQGSTPYLQKEEKWSDKGDLISIDFTDASSTLIEKREFSYDAAHFLIKEILSNNKESYTTTFEYSTDSLHNLIKKTDAIGRSWIYHYIPSTNLCSAQYFLSNEKILKRSFYKYDEKGVCIEEIEDDGHSWNREDLSTITQRVIARIHPIEKGACIGFTKDKECWAQKSDGQLLYTGKKSYKYTPYGALSYEADYDLRGRLISEKELLYNDQEKCSAKIDPEGHTILFGYDQWGRVVQIVGPLLGQSCSIEYDHFDRPTKIAHSENEAPLFYFSKEYDLCGNLVKERLEDGSERYFEYDLFARCVKKRGPDGAEEHFQYTPLGKLVQTKDPLGEITHYTTNLLGSVTSKRYADGREEYWEYDAVGRELMNHTPLGAHIKKVFDPFDHLVCEEVMDREGNALKKTSYSYSAFNKTSQVDPNGLVTQFFYDPQGRCIQEQRGERIVTKAYDDAGRLSTEKQADFVLHYFYNRRGEKIREERRSTSGRLHHWTEFDYDALGNQTIKKTADGEWKSSFNAFKKPIAAQDPEGNLTHYFYSWSSGKETKKVMPDQVTYTFYFDSMDREIRKTIHSPKGALIHEEKREYDLKGQLLAHEIIPTSSKGKLPSKRHECIWGKCGQLKSFHEAGRFERNYFYSPEGLMIKEVKPDKTTIHRDYDELGRLIRLWGDGVDYQYHYDGADKVIRVRNGINQREIERVYNYYGELESERFERGTTLDSVYDRGGRRVQLRLPDTSSIETTFKEGRFHTLRRKEALYEQARYDSCSRPSLAYYPFGKGRLETNWDCLGRPKKIFSPLYTFHSPLFEAQGNLISFYENGEFKRFEYDYLNQLIKEEGHEYGYDSSFNRISYDNEECVIDESDQLLKCGDKEITYDLNGNLTEFEGWFFTYDLLDRLVSANHGAETYLYTYDGFDRRLSTALVEGGLPIHIRHYLWDNQEEIGEEDSKGTLTHLRICDPAGRVRIVEIEGCIQIPVEDFRGNLIGYLGTDKLTYTAFGIEDGHTRIDLPWRFSSKRTDAETGFVYFGKRFYIPELGRWLTPDPLGFEDGINKYAFLHNHPLTAKDVEGLFERPMWTKQIWGEMENVDIPEVLDFATAIFTPRGVGNIERAFKNKSYQFSTGALPLASGKGISFINGMLTTKDFAMDHANYISKISGGHKIHGIYNATNGAVVDSMECFAQLGWGLSDEPVCLLSNFFKDYFKENGPNASLLHICHSQGAIITKNALRQTPPEIREKIKLVCIAPGGYALRNHCKDARYYTVMDGDFVHLFDFPERLRNLDRCRAVHRHPDAPRFLDHNFQSPSFKEVLENEILSYLRE